MLHQIKKVLLKSSWLIALFFCIQPIFAQTKPKEVNIQNQSWFSLNSTTRLTTHWGFIADAHMRRNQFIADPSFYFLRGAINYWVTDNITLTAGYGKMWLAPTIPGWKKFAQEDRLYIQIQSISKLGKISIAKTQKRKSLATKND
jgi:Protein of unknown function (DUF2490)